MEQGRERTHRALSNRQSFSAGTRGRRGGGHGGHHHDEEEEEEEDDGLSRNGGSGSNGRAVNWRLHNIYNGIAGRSGRSSRLTVPVAAPLVDPSLVLRPNQPGDPGTTEDNPDSGT